jgi:PKD repeat protein/photosystem II stability/assembly factor-like uncharacterized protein
LRLLSLKCFIMRKLLFIFLLAVPSFLFGQGWTKNLPEKRGGELTLIDYQKAFEQYCSDNNVDRNGYLMRDGKKVKMPGFKQFKRWEWYWETQVDAQGRFPKQTANQVLRNFERNNHSISRAGESGEWVNLGTNSSDGGYHGIGRLNCIAFHPTDINTYWVGAPAGGLWVTYNDGTSWEVLTDDNAVLGVSDIIIPSDYETSKTIYIATGDRDAQDNHSIGILKSTDNGLTWNETGLSFDVSDNVMANRLLLDPNDDNTIIAAVSGGVYKTTNGGDSWDLLAVKTFIDMEYKPGDYSILYGSTSNGDIYKSTDGGSNWASVKSLSAGRIELAVTPANDAVVYAVVGGTNNGLYGIYKSTDSGASFDRVFNGTTTGNNLLGWYKGDNYSEGGQAFYDLAIAASPEDENIVLIGGINTWRSKDGGTNWDMVNHWNGYGAQPVHADKHMLTYRSNGDLFECNDGGVYLSTKDGNSYSWKDKTDGIVNSQIYKLGVCKQDSNYVITGLQDNGTKLMQGEEWRDVKGGDGMECLIDYSNKNIQYGSYVYGQIDRTTNNWYSGSVTDISPSSAGSGAWVTPYIIDPEIPATLYAGYSYVWKTTDRGNSWTKISTTSHSYKIREMAICQTNNQVIWYTDHINVYKTEDGGTNWSKIEGLPSSIKKSYIAIKDNDPKTVWVTLFGYGTQKVYKTTDGGSNWEDISEGLPSLPVNTVVYDASISGIDVIYVGTDVGVYQKKGTEAFTKFSEGLPNVKIDELEIYYDEDPAKNKLRAATYGRGLWETSIKGIFVAPIASFNANSKSILEGSSVVFENTSENVATSLKWYFEGGTPSTSTEANPTVTYNTAGNYQVALVASNEIGEDSIAIDGYISVYTEDLVPPIGLTASVNKFNVELNWKNPEGGDIVFEESFEGAFPPTGWTIDKSMTIDGDHTYAESDTNWFKCDENSFGTPASPEYIHSGTYSAAIGYVAPNFNWLKTSQFTVKDNFELRFWMWYYNDADYFTNFHVMYNDGSGWNALATHTEGSDVNEYTTEQVISLAALSGKTIQLAFVYEYTDGYQMAIDDVYVGVTKSLAPQTSVQGIIENVSRLEQNKSAQTALDNRAGTAYKVYRNNELIGTIDNFATTNYSDVVDSAANYTYNVVAVYEEPAGEVSSNYIQVTVHPFPTAAFEADVVSGDGPLTVTFANQSTNAIDYLWDFGDGTTSKEKNPVHEYVTGGKFTVSLIAYSNYYSDTLVKEDYITAIYPEVVANFEADVVSGTDPLEVNFTNLTTGAEKYKWLFGDGYFSFSTNPSHTYSKIGVYDVTLIAWNDGNTDTLTKVAYIDVHVGIKDVAGENTIKVYPNPANDYLEINFNEFNANGAEIEMLNMSGKIVNQTQFSSPTKKHRFSLEGLENGIYLLRIKNNESQKIFKVNKQ